MDDAITLLPVVCFGNDATTSNTGAACIMRKTISRFEESKFRGREDCSVVVFKLCFLTRVSSIHGLQFQALKTEEKLEKLRKIIEEKSTIDGLLILRGARVSVRLQVEFRL